jgi:hypothetical protein
MVKVRNILGDVLSGTVGKVGVYANWKGIQYRRAYVIPANPQTTKQTEVRDNLANAINRWHEYNTEQRRAYGYMAGGLAMSGFNLFCKRWQLAMPTSDADMIVPSLGIKQCGHTKQSKTNTSPLPTNHSFTLTFGPVVIGSAVFTKSDTDLIMDAYVEITQGFVRLPLDISDHGGANAAGNAIAEGDQLVISYQSSGRIVTREVLYTVGAGGDKIPAAATMALALRTKYAPIDYGTVVIETCDVSETPDEYTQMESAEIDPVNHKVYYDTTDPTVAASKWDYDVYTALEDTKLEMTKADTSFIAWRDYADADGFLPVSATKEDETFDCVFTLTGHTSVLKTAKPAAQAALTEFIDMGAP